MQAIEGNASVHLAAAKLDGGIGYALVDLSSAILPIFDTSDVQSLRSLSLDRGPPPEATLGTGDVVTVTIFESQSGGLFIPQNGNVPGNYVTLPAQAVDKQGMITVPYVGAVKLAGRSVPDVQKEIQQRLANKAIEPQVIITTTQSRSDKVSVLGDVNAPAELDVSPAGERVLDMISRVGGLKASAVESYLTVERRGRATTELFATIVSNPADNIFVRPGDTLYVTRERRTYLAFGASGLNGRFDFQESNLTLGEALGQAGGLLDNRADPSQVFVYRQVDRAQLIKAGVDVSSLSGQSVPVIFRANMRDPATFFAVQKFRMQDKDILYISNSGSTDLAKVLDVINGVSNTTANVAVNALSTRDSMSALGH